MFLHNNNDQSDKLFRVLSGKSDVYFVTSELKLKLMAIFSFIVYLG